MAEASLSSHVLDLQTGHPAPGLKVTLYSSGSTRMLASGVTDADGRIKTWAPGLSLADGVYQLVFATGDWFAERRQPTLYPQVQISFNVDGSHPHYHIPLLLSPFGYSTYRGS